MSTPGTFVGLCVTCNNSSTCVYRKRRGTDAIYCELYDGFALPENGGGGSAKATPEKQVDIGMAQAKGLCVNCAHRDTCQLAKSECGVWHCEEYE